MLENFSTKEIRAENNHSLMDMNPGPTKLQLIGCLAHCTSAHYEIILCFLVDNWHCSFLLYGYNWHIFQLFGWHLHFTFFDALSAWAFNECSNVIEPLSKSQRHFEPYVSIALVLTLAVTESTLQSVPWFSSHLVKNIPALMLCSAVRCAKHALVR